MKSIQSIHLFLVVLIAFGLTSCGKETEETTPIRKDVSETVFASGTLQADGLYRLTAQSSGYLTGLHFQEGDLITAGTLLAEIEDLDNQINVQSSDQLLQIAEQNAAPDGPLLVQAQKNIDIAKERMEQDRKTAARYKRLWESNSIAKIEYENAQLAFENSESNFEIALENYQKIQLDAKQQVIHNKTTSDLHRTGQGKTQVKAFSNGKVYKKYKEVGDFVRQGDVIAEIGDPTLLYALVNVDETNIARVQPGQKAVVRLNTHAEQAFPAEVREILPSFDEATQSFLCKLYFSEVPDFQIIHTQLQSNILVGEQKNALLIPRNYIDFGGYVQVKGQKEKQKVETKFVSNEWVQVLSGIDESTILITDNLN